MKTYCIGCMVLLALSLVFIPVAAASPDEQQQCGGGQIYYNTAYNGYLNQGCQDYWYFEGQTGDIVTIALEGAGSGELSFPLSDPYLELMDPYETIVTSDDDSGVDYNALINYTLQATGTYYIVARSYNGEGGGYLLTLNGQQSPSCSLYTANYGGSLLYNQSTYDFMGGPCGTSWSFYGSFGDILNIDLITSDFDPYVELYTSGGELLTWNDDGGDGLNSRISGYQLPFSDTFYIVARPLVSGEGSYELFVGLDATPTPTTDPTCRVTVVTNTLNLRSGPGTVYPTLTSFPSGTTALVRGYNGNWWQVQVNSWIGWFSSESQFTTATGDCSRIPFVVAQPPPTFTPTSTSTRRPTATPTRRVTATYTSTLHPTATFTFTATSTPTSTFVIASNPTTAPISGGGTTGGTSPTTDDPAIPSVVIITISASLGLGTITLRFLKDRQRAWWEQRTESEDMPEECRSDERYCRKVEIKTDLAHYTIKHITVDFHDVEREQILYSTEIDDREILDGLNRSLVRLYMRQDDTQIQPLTITASVNLLEKLKELMRHENDPRLATLSGHIEGSNITVEYQVYKCVQAGPVRKWKQIDKWKRTINDKKDTHIVRRLRLLPAEPELPQRLSGEMNGWMLHFLKRVL